MNNNKLYEEWKKHKTKIDIESNLAESVMCRIHQYEQKKDKPLFDIRYLIKAAMVVLGAVAGFLRTAVMIYVLLFAT
jgi:hypothetical protein